MKTFMLLIALLAGTITSFGQTHFKEAIHYLLPEFTFGTIRMNDGETRRALLNYNRLTEEMIFNHRGQNLAINEEYAAKIAYIRIAGRTFYLHEGNFVELIYSNGIKLYANYKARINDPGGAAGYGMRSHSGTTTRYLRLTLPTEVYNLDLPPDLVPVPYTYYWLYKDGQYFEISDISRLRRLYSDRREKFRNYPGLNELDFNEPAEILRLIKHLEGLE